MTATTHEEQISLPSVQTNNAVRESMCTIYNNSYADGGLSDIGNCKIYDGESVFAMGKLADGFSDRLGFGINGSTKAPSPTQVPVEAPIKAPRSISVNETKMGAPEVNSSLYQWPSCH